MTQQPAAPTPPRLVPLTPADAGRIKTLEETVWFEISPGVTPEQWVETLDFTHAAGVETDDPPRLAAPAGTPLVGLYAAFDMQVTVPGPHATPTRRPMSGLSWVGVHPDHRRRGILRQLMRHHLHGVHEAGQAAVAGLWAAETGIYGRFGYGTASFDVLLELPRGADLTVPPELTEAATSVRTHMVPVDSDEATAALHALHLAAAEGQPGAVTRPETVRRGWFRETPKARGTKEPRQVLFATRDGDPVGYAVFRRESQWSDYSVPGGTLRVAELAAVDQAALLALVTRLIDFDLTSKVILRSRGVEDPVLWWAGGPRSTTARITDALWLRVVDVPRALGERGYAAAADLVLEVTDDLCPWNARCWRLTTGADGVGRCLPSEDRPDVHLPVQALGASYAGGRSLVSQAAVGVLSETRPGAIVELSRAMRGDTEPQGTIGF